jgi:SAM-dependent methyltransferase
MGLKGYLRKALNSALKRRDCEIIESQRLYEWQRKPIDQPSYHQSKLPDNAANYLNPGNSRLQELHARYTDFNKEVTIPLVWTDTHVKADDTLYFRGDNAYVWQLRGSNMNIMAYALTTYYVRSIDNLRLLELLTEDDFFGNYNFRIDNRLVSRDLLDSIMEIYFLEKHLNLSRSTDVTVLDIGAGYGRLAHRMACALPNIQSYLCTDAVAISSFLSEYYLRFRGMEPRTQVVPLDEIENALKNRAVDLAINIHSFSECRLEAIDWWLTLLVKHRVKHLMIVPNAHNHGGERLQTNDRQDFSKLLEKHGYKIVAKEPKYRDPVVQKYGINPTYHYLFELMDTSRNCLD